MPDSTFIVVRSPGPAWNDELPMAAQANWAEHARFMNDLAAQGFVRLGGPMSGAPDVLLIVQAETEQQVRETLERDPWVPAGTLTVGNIRRWTILLNSGAPL